MTAATAPGSGSDPASAAARARMVEDHLRARGICDPRVLAAMAEVPREAFVSPELASAAYADQPLPIAAGQTISQPYIVALMTELLTITPGDAVLEIGTGSGYAAAVLSRLARHVYTVERHAELAESASDRLRQLGCANVTVRCGDGTLGWPEHAPFDAIAVTAAGASPPPPLVAQLAIGGRLVMPVGSREVQSLIRLTRRADGDLHGEDFGLVRFVPLIGARA